MDGVNLLPGPQFVMYLARMDDEGKKWIEIYHPKAKHTVNDRFQLKVQREGHAAIFHRKARTIRVYGQEVTVPAMYMLAELIEWDGPAEILKVRVVARESPGYDWQKCMRRLQLEAVKIVLRRQMAFGESTSLDAFGGGRE